MIHGNIDTENPFNSDKQFFEEVSQNNKTRFWEFDNLAHNYIFSPAILADELPIGYSEKTQIAAFSLPPKPG